VFELLESIKEKIEAKTYYFWDTLTSTVVLRPEIIQVKDMYLKVELQGPSEGKTVQTDKEVTFSNTIVHLFL
jgi:inosine-uridine nucleoside N-ribohydrolase